MDVKEVEEVEGYPVELRFITYLTPSIPLSLFQAIVEGVGRALGVATRLAVETRTSGPPRGQPDPFSTGEQDVGFLCSPSYIWLRERRPPPVGLLPAAMLFRDERSQGRPVYFSDVIVRRDSPAASFLDLEGARWAYNDVASLSGYHSVLQKLAEMDLPASFFGRLERVGSHLAAIRSVLEGSVHAAAIDSNVLRLRFLTHPELAGRLRVLESWGPFPIQPVVAGSDLKPELKDGLARALLELAKDQGIRETLGRFGLEGFVPVDEAFYDAEAQQLRRCQAVEPPG